MGPMLVSMARDAVLWPSIATLTILAAAFLARVPMKTASAIAIGCGFLVGYTSIYGKYAFPPIEAQGWLPFLIILNFLVFSIDDRLAFRWQVRLVLQAFFSCLGTILIFLPLVKTGVSYATLFISIALWLGLWIAIDRREGPALFLAAAGNAVVSATTGSTMLGQFGGILATVLGVHLLFNIPKNRIPLGHAGTAVSVSILASLMLIGHVYAETALFPSLLLLIAFGGPYAAKKLIHREGWQFVIGFALALIPVAIASAIAVKSYLSQEY